MHSIKWDHVINLPQDPEVVEDFPELFSVKKVKKAFKNCDLKIMKKKFRKKKTQEKEKLKEKIKKKIKNSYFWIVSNLKRM